MSVRLRQERSSPGFAAAACALIASRLERPVSTRPHEETHLPDDLAPERDTLEGSQTRWEADNR
jgi:hypothetical protein